MEIPEWFALKSDLSTFRLFDLLTIRPSNKTALREFVAKTFTRVDIDIEFEGEGQDQVARVLACHNEEFQIPLGKIVVAVDPTYFRPTEVDLLVGDATKARQKLGWTLEYDLDALIDDMVTSDLKVMRKEQFLKENGYQILNYFE